MSYSLAFCGHLDRSLVDVGRALSRPCDRARAALELSVARLDVGGVSSSR